MSNSRQISVTNFLKSWKSQTQLKWNPFLIGICCTFYVYHVLHQSRVSSTILKKRLGSSLSWKKSWRQRYFKKSDWLFRGLETRKDWFFTGNQNFGLVYLKIFIRTNHVDNLKRNKKTTLYPSCLFYYYNILGRIWNKTTFQFPADTLVVNRWQIWNHLLEIQTRSLFSQNSLIGWLVMSYDYQGLKNY